MARAWRVRSASGRQLVLSSEARNFATGRSSGEKSSSRVSRARVKVKIFEREKLMPYFSAVSRVNSADQFGKGTSRTVAPNFTSGAMLAGCKGKAIAWRNSSARAGAKDGSLSPRAQSCARLVLTGNPLCLPWKALTNRRNSSESTSASFSGVRLKAAAAERRKLLRVEVIPASRSRSASSSALV